LIFGTIFETTYIKQNTNKLLDSIKTISYLIT